MAHIPVEVGGRQLKNWDLWLDLSEEPIIETPLTFLFLLSAWTFYGELEESGLALIEATNQPGKFERIGYVMGDVKDISQEDRLRLDEPPTQEITIV